MNWLALISAGLGTARIVNWVKEVVPSLDRREKAALSAVVAPLLATGMLWSKGPPPKRGKKRSKLAGHPSVQEAVIVSIGAEGVAMIAHQVTAALQSKKDLDRLAVRKNMPQRRPGPGGM